MPPNRRIHKLPFVLSLIGIILWFLTIHFYISLEGAHYVIPGYRVPADPQAVRVHWKFIALSGVFLLMLVLVFRWSVRIPNDHDEFRYAGFWAFFAIVLTFVLIFHFCFTVCA